MAKLQAVHAPQIPCGLPSPGSRLQSLQGEEHRRPMQTEQALVAKPGELITCRRCKRIVKRARG